MYKLNKNSKLIRFYNWLWNTDATKYKTMCPLFWAYVFSIIFLVIILLGKLIYFLLPAKKQVNTTIDYISETKLGKKTESIVQYISNMNNFWYYVGKTFKWILIITGFCWCLFFIGFISYKWYLNPIIGFAIFGIISLVFIILIALIYLVEYLIEETFVFEYLKKPFVFIWDMIYSLYKNVCPIIIWEKNEIIDKRTTN